MTFSLSQQEPGVFEQDLTETGRSGESAGKWRVHPALVVSLRVEGIAAVGLELLGGISSISEEFSLEDLL